MSKKSDKQIVPDALERHFRLLIGFAIVWLGADQVIAIAEMSKREDERDDGAR